ncbi:MAG: TIGR00269 family protein [Sulfolobales archaeon]|nr:TIGR00269 family protein [Sulfolobales archaeon]MDW8083508.1 TIGR00269 family protein [Sulfolobales archaeon]
MVKYCDICGRTIARVLQKHSGRALCDKCFREDLVTRLRDEVSRYRMFTPSDRILLALSGGKDSFVLLDIVREIHDTGKIGIITIVEGVEGYNRADDVFWIIEASRNYGIDLHLTSFKEFTGFSLDEIVSLDRLKKLETSPCTYCGVLRRRIINYYARSLGYSKVVTAHNLDDEVQTYLMNLLRGDEGRLIQTHPLSSTLSKFFIKRVKPLRKIYEWETSAYALTRGFKFQEVECPYIRFRPTLRAELRNYLYELERLKPGTLLKILEAVDRYVERELLKKALKLTELPQCSICGSPTAYSRNTCILCDLLGKIEINTKLPF